MNLEGWQVQLAHLRCKVVVSCCCWEVAPAGCMLVADLMVQSLLVIETCCLLRSVILQGLWWILQELVRQKWLWLLESVAALVHWLCLYLWKQCWRLVVLLLEWCSLGCLHPIVCVLSILNLAAQHSEGVPDALVHFFQSLRLHEAEQL